MIIMNNTISTKKCRALLTALHSVGTPCQIPQFVVFNVVEYITTDQSTPKLTNAYFALDHYDSHT